MHRTAPHHGRLRSTRGLPQEDARDQSRAENYASLKSTALWPAPIAAAPTLSVIVPLVEHLHLGRRRAVPELEVRADIRDEVLVEAEAVLVAANIAALLVLLGLLLRRGEVRGQQIACVLLIERQDNEVHRDETVSRADGVRSQPRPVVVGVPVFAHDGLLLRATFSSRAACSARSSAGSCYLAPKSCLPVPVRRRDSALSHILRIERTRLGHVLPI